MNYRNLCSKIFIMIRNILNKLLRRVSRSKEYILNRSKIHKVNVELLEHKMKEFIIYIIIFHGEFEVYDIYFMF